LDEAIAAEYEELKERMEMNIFGTALFPYIQGEMLKDVGQITMTIADVREEELVNNRGKDIKPIVFFKEKKKGLILNKTNAKTLAAMFGAETDDWRGERIFLYAERGTWFGKTGYAVRVSEDVPDNGNGKPAAKSAPASVDELPFDFPDDEPPEQLYDDNGEPFAVDGGRPYISDTPGPHYNPKLREKALGTRKLETFAEAAAEYMNDGRTGQDVIEWLTGRDDYEYDRANNAETLDAMQGAAAMHDKAEEA
jgi:hypothetical protein